MFNTKKYLFCKLTLLMVIAIIVGACKSSVQKTNQIKIGLSMAELHGRWAKDKEFFVEKAEQLGAKVYVTDADLDENLQVKQCLELLEKGIDILVVLPQNDSISRPIVEAAHAKGVKVISYDRLITNADVDLYITFDNLKVGQLQAKHITQKQPEGNYIILGGDPGDYNATVFKKGQMQILQPLIDSGKINIVADFWTPKYDPEIAYQKVKQVLDNNPNIQAIVAANDAVAGGAIKALKEYGLAGKVLVSGQDADLKSCTRILKGQQEMTIYKSLIDMAHTAAAAAIGLAEYGEMPDSTKKLNVYSDKIPVVLLNPIAVDKYNLKEIVFTNQFHSKEDMFGSADQPKK